jgi:hypothetical protein
VLVLCALVVVAPLASVHVADAQGLRISVFGDSVLLGAAEEIQATLAGNDVTVDAHENLSLLGSLSTFEAARPTMGDVVVLDLGYNDGADLTAWRDRIDRATAILNGVPKVIWLSQRDFAAGRADMNAELVAATQRYPNLEVVDWNTVVDAQPGLVYGDGIHLTPAGQNAMADLVRSRIDAYVAARIAATSTTLPPTTTTTTTTTVAPSASAASGAAGRHSHQLATGAENHEGDHGWVWIPVAAVGVLLALGIAVRLWLRNRSPVR